MTMSTGIDAHVLDELSAFVRFDAVVAFAVVRFWGCCCEEFDAVRGWLALWEGRCWAWRWDRDPAPLLPGPLRRWS